MLDTAHNPKNLPGVPPELLDFLISQTPDKRLGIAQLDANHLKNGTIAELAASYLAEPEKQQFATYTFAKRRRQWLFGRICAKQSLLQLLEKPGGRNKPAPLDIVIDVAPGGRPFLHETAAALFDSTPDISISHSHDRIIAIAAHGRCGIDVQVLTDTLFKVQSRFCSTAENMLLQSLIDDELPQLGLLWTAKEAVRKSFSSFRTLGFQEMALTGIEHRASTALLTMQLTPSCTGINTVTVAAAVLDGYCLGACVIPEKPGHA